MVLYRYSMACSDYNALIKCNVGRECDIAGFSFDNQQLYFDFGF